jgi:ribosomal protein L16/L10AE
MIDEARIKSLTVLIMEVPCCGGLLQVAQAAVNKAERKVPVKRMVVGIQGEILDEAWV